jgi:hypothetical protein
MRHSHTSEDGGRADFSNNMRLSALMTTYKMSLILAGSISLDSTFNVASDNIVDS